MAPRGNLWYLSGPYRGRVGCTLASQVALSDLFGPTGVEWAHFGSSGPPQGFLWDLSGSYGADSNALWRSKRPFGSSLGSTKVDSGTLWHLKGWLWDLFGFPLGPSCRCRKLPPGCGRVAGGLPPGCHRIENRVFQWKNHGFQALAPRGILWYLSPPYTGRVGCTLASQVALWDVFEPYGDRVGRTLAAQDSLMDVFGTSLGPTGADSGAPLGFVFKSLEV